MYCLSDAQIEFIRNDIRARGVALESLQADLLDHVCCLIEQSFEGGSDFEAFYFETIRKFYLEELKEIEVETLFLLHHKNYYAMKKVMLISGAFSAFMLCIGIWFKFMHWAGAGVLIVAGIALFSLIFLPLLFTLKLREKQQATERFSIGIGTLSAIGFSLGTLFKIMHWPGANLMGISAIGLLVLVFLPVYFFTGIKNSATKLNTIVTSILIIAGAGLLMSLVRSPGNSMFINTLNTEHFVRNERLLQQAQKQFGFSPETGTVPESNAKQTREIYARCTALKAYILEKETGYKTLPLDFKEKQILLNDGWIRDYFKQGTPAANKLTSLRNLVETYNRNNTAAPDFLPVPVDGTILDRGEERTLASLNNLTQIQMQVLQNGRPAITAM